MHQLTATPVDVDDALFAQPKQQFSDKQLVELASAIAWENYLARSNRLYNIASYNFSHGAFCPMPAPHR